MTISIRFLPANHGDCIFLSHCRQEHTFNVLIDGGPASTFGALWGFARPLRGLLDQLRAKEQSIDLAILTHVDDDHIGGFLAAFSYDQYLPSMAKEIWFNSYQIIAREFGLPDDPNNQTTGILSQESKTSIRQGRTLEEKLEGLNWRKSLIHNAIDKIVEGPLEITILSPSLDRLEKLASKWEREITRPSRKTSSASNDYRLRICDIIENDIFVDDISVPNGSSIAFLLEVDNKSILLLGDSHENVVRSKLIDLGYSETNPLKVDLVKISHHGSKSNTSTDLLKLIDTDKYVISTDGSIFGHPDKVTIARILSHNPNSEIFFNYDSVVKRILLPEEKFAYQERLKVLPSELML